MITYAQWDGYRRAFIPPFAQGTHTTRETWHTSGEKKSEK